MTSDTKQGQGASSLFYEPTRPRATWGSNNWIDCARVGMRRVGGLSASYASDLLFSCGAAEYQNLPPVGETMISGLKISSAIF